MVADSKCSIGDTWFEDPKKIVRFGDELIGFCGWATEGDRWLEWYTNGQRGPKPKITNSGALFLGPYGIRGLDSTGEFVPIARGFHGMGSGGSYAVAAYMAGAKAKQAVEIACAIDVHSGGTIIVQRLKK